MPSTGRLGSIAGRLAAAVRILVVEDEQDLAGFLGAWFRASGYDLVHCDPGSLDELMKTIDELQPQCILLDVGLRGFSGLDAYERIRATKRLDHTPVIVVSADVTAKSQLKAMTSQLDDFVAKPFSVNALGELVKERIELARLDSLADPAAESGALARRNYDELQQEAEREISRLDDDLTALTLLMVTLARHRAVEREVGERGVDVVLRHIANGLLRLFGGRASAARSIHDELVVIAPGIDADAVRDEVRELLETLATTPVPMPGGAEVTARLHAGMACFPDHAATADELFMACEAALADAREQQRELVAAL